MSDLEGAYFAKQPLITASEIPTFSEIYSLLRYFYII